MYTLLIHLNDVNNLIYLLFNQLSSVLYELEMLCNYETFINYLEQSL